MPSITVAIAVFFNRSPAPCPKTVPKSSNINKKEESGWGE